MVALARQKQMLRLLQMIPAELLPVPSIQTRRTVLLVAEAVGQRVVARLVAAQVLVNQAGLQTDCTAGLHRLPSDHAQMEPVFRLPLVEVAEVEALQKELEVVAVEAAELDGQQELVALASVAAVA